MQTGAEDGEGVEEDGVKGEAIFQGSRVQGLLTPRLQVLQLASTRVGGKKYLVVRNAPDA